MSNKKLDDEMRELDELQRNLLSGVNVSFHWRPKKGNAVAATYLTIPTAIDQRSCVFVFKTFDDAIQAMHYVQNNQPSRKFVMRLTS